MQCGADIAEGKKFCGKCGKPVTQSATGVDSATLAGTTGPAVAAGSQVTSTLPVEAANAPVASGEPRVCVHCGNAVPEGKRFCNKCGNPVALPETAQSIAAPVVEPIQTVTAEPMVPTSEPAVAAAEPVEEAAVAEEVSTGAQGSPIAAVSLEPVAEPAPQLCAYCGNKIPAGKRFCGKCGKPVAPLLEDFPAAVPEPARDMMTPLPVESSIPQQAIEETIASPEPKAEEALPVAAIAAAIPAEQRADAPQPVLTKMAVASEGPSSETPADRLPLPGKSRGRDFDVAPPYKPASSVPWQKYGLGLAAAVVVIAAAATGFWLYRRHVAAIAVQQAAAKAAAPAPQTAPTPVPTNSNSQQEQTPPSPVVNSAQKPSAGQSTATQPVSSQGHAQIASSKPPAPSTASLAHLQPPSASVAHPHNEAVATAPSPIVNTPAPHSSGTLHYSGPPVPYGGVIVFSNLRGGRLRFVYDRSSWQALISRQPDGSQTLTLRSLQHADQSRCDVQWEALP